VISPPFAQIAAVAWLSRPAWPSRGALVRFRDRQLRRIVRHAYAHVPFYRRTFDAAGVRPERIRTAADLAALPIVTRNALRDAPIEDVVARGVRAGDLIQRVTSGSSGTPLSIRRTWFEERLLNGFRWRSRHYHGLRARDRIALLQLTRPIHPRDHQMVAAAARVLGLYPSLKLNCLDPPERIIASLRSYRPDIVIGFAGVLAHLGGHLDDSDRMLIRPRFVGAGGEVLTPLMRTQIERGFGAPVRETYGSHEFNILGWQCLETGALHVSEDCTIVEVLTAGGRPAEPGERGEVVATALFSYAAPFIRYRLGDLVTATGRVCQCGLPYPAIRGVQGRMIDYFPLPDGTVLHPYDIAWPALQHLDWLRQYSIVQERPDRIVVRMAATRDVGDGELRALERHLGGQVGPSASVQCVIVPEIAIGGSGKFRVSHSMVESQYENVDWERFGAET
jgi:phenylacetate-CoA ligase